MRAFKANKPGGDPCLALTIFDNALEVLDWSRTGAWKDISIQDEGVLRGLFCAYCAPSATSSPHGCTWGYYVGSVLRLTLFRTDFRKGCGEHRQEDT